MGDGRLAAVAVAPSFRIGGVRGPQRVVVLEPAVGAVVDGQAEDGEVVRVHHPVDKAHAQPVDHQLGRGPADLGEPLAVDRGRRLAQVREQGADGEVGQPAEDVQLTPGREQLVVAEAQERRRHPADHRARLLLGSAVVEHVALHHLAGEDQAECPGGGYAQVVHGLAAQELAQGGAHHRQPVGPARIGRGPGALELQGPVFAPAVDRLAQVDGPAVAQLAGPVAELVPAVAGGVRVHAGQHQVAGKHPGEKR